VKKLLLRGVLASLILLVAGLVTGTAAADPTDAQCDPADQAQITAVLSADGHQATYTVHNALPLCDPVDVGLAVYLKNADGFVVPQDLSAWSAGSIATGTTTLTVQLPGEGTSPQCFTQVDAFKGTVLQQITDTQQYGPRLFTYQFGQTETCVEAESITSSTTTTSTSSTTSTTSTSSTTSTTLHNDQSSSPPPNEVAGTEFTQAEAAGTQVAGAALPRTGSQFDVHPLVMVSGLLVLAGGALTAWTKRPHAPM
jgi:hypothetical protein